jgi:hypothetical protein
MMKVKRLKTNQDVTETRQTARHCNFSVEVINPRNGWAELLPEEFEFVSALRIAKYLSGEGARLYSKPVLVLSAE